jgi:hypothetical protein
MTKYILIFAATYLLAIVVSLLVSSLILQTGMGNVATLFISAWVASRAFVKDYGRVPTKAEKRSLAWGSYLAALMVSGFLVAGFLLVSRDGGEIARSLIDIDLWIWAIALSVITLISGGILLLCYGWLTRMFANQA